MTNDNPDANSASPDAPKTVDAPRPNVDAPPTGPATRVWVYGDFLTNNTTQLGTFVHESAQMPVTMTGIPSTGKLYDLLGTPFSINANGTKIAYVADSTVAGRWDLFLADADGGNAVTVTTAVNTATITDPSFSPDGTKLAFVSDRDVATQKDIYVVDAAASSTPVRVSPARNNVALDASSFVWSPDSKLLAMTGDFATDARYALWTVDTTAATPAPVQVLTDAENLATTPNGVLSPGPKWVSNTKVVFYGALTAAGDRHLYVATAGTAGVTELASTAITRADSTKAEAHVFGISPDLSKIVFSSDGITATAFELYVANTDGTGTPTRLTAGTTRAGSDLDGFEELAFSPDGMKVAVVADWGATDAKYEPYVVSLAGGDLHRVAIPGDPIDAMRDASKLQWTRGGAKLYFRADGGATDNEFGLWVANPVMTDGTATLAVSAPVNGDVSGVITRDVP